MYTSAAGVWKGFSKNLYEGLGESPLALAVVIALYFTTFILPYLLLAVAPWVPDLWLPAVIGTVLNLGLRAVMAVRYRQPLDSAVLHPVGVLVLLAIAVNSWRWARSGTIEWAGRTYAARSARRAP